MPKKNTYHVINPDTGKPVTEHDTNFTFSEHLNIMPSGVVTEGEAPPEKFNCLTIKMRDLHGHWLVFPIESVEEAARLVEHISKCAVKVWGEAYFHEKRKN